MTRSSERPGAGSGRSGLVPGVRSGGHAAVATLALALLLALAACGWMRNDTEEEGMTERPSIEEVLEAHTRDWMELPGVVGTGIGLCDDGEPCIRVFLSGPSPEAEEAIPDRVEGHRVELVVTGVIRPRPG